MSNTRSALTGETPPTKTTNIVGVDIALGGGRSSSRRRPVMPSCEAEACRLWELKQRSSP
ncbi:hypothetical protein ACQ5SK_06325 [Bradyrhizobium japonicum]